MKKNFKKYDTVLFNGYVWLVQSVDGDTAVLGALKGGDTIRVLTDDLVSAP